MYSTINKDRPKDGFFWAYLAIYLQIFVKISGNDTALNQHGSTALEENLFCNHHRVILPD